MYLDATSQLRDLYDAPSHRARAKQLGALERHSIRFIEASPFVVVASTGADGTIDASPRGGAPGFVHVASDTCLLIPDAKGNNRVDTLTNVIETGAIGCLFLIPGVDETLRVNGSARVSTFPDHLARFAELTNPPRSCIEVTITEVFLHCAKAFMRSRLWAQESHVERSDLPTMGEMLKDQLGLDAPAESREAMVRRYEPDL